MVAIKNQDREIAIAENQKTIRGSFIGSRGTSQSRRGRRKSKNSRELKSPKDKNKSN